LLDVAGAADLVAHGAGLHLCDLSLRRVASTGVGGGAGAGDALADVLDFRACRHAPTRTASDWPVTRQIGRAHDARRCFPAWRGFDELFRRPTGLATTTGPGSVWVADSRRTGFPSSCSNGCRCRLVAQISSSASVEV